MRNISQRLVRPLVRPPNVEPLQGREVKERRDLIQWFEPSEALELGQRESDLRLVVDVGEAVRILLPQFRREVLVGIDLQGQSLRYGQYFGQMRQLRVEPCDDLLA